MDELRKEALLDNWNAETSEPESQEWREDLTEEEAALVESWDKKYSKGIYNLCSDILAAEEKRGNR